jgi:hypothetical protein
MDYDIIGDVHGHADKLIKLLEKMGYRDEGGVYRHPGRQVVFVGDLIDRGPHQREVTNLVRTMVQGGSALATMGNHEFNALAWHTEDPDQPGEYLRPHVPTKYKQHAAFLEQWASDPRGMRETLDWFWTLPLFLELEDGSRVVHACWHEPSLAVLRERMGPGDTLTPALLLEASRRHTPGHQAIEAVLKGLEVTLPTGHGIYDKAGHLRDNARIRWWEREGAVYGDAIFPRPTRTSPGLLELDLPEPLPYHYPADAPRVFFGHYWVPTTAEPAPQRANVICVDYSAGKGGWLCAARTSGSSQTLVWV